VSDFLPEKHSFRQTVIRENGYNPNMLAQTPCIPLGLYTEIKSKNRLYRELVSTEFSNEEIILNTKI